MSNEYEGKSDYGTSGVGTLEKRVNGSGLNPDSSVEDDELKIREEKLKREPLFAGKPEDLEAMLNKMRDDLIESFYKINSDGSRISRWKTRLNIIVSKLRHRSFDEAEQLYVDLQRDILNGEYQLRDSLYEEGRRYQDEKEQLEMRIRDLTTDLDKLDKIINNKEVRVQELNKVLAYKVALKEGREVEKPAGLTRIILDNYMNKRIEEIQGEKKETRVIIYNARRDHEKESDEFRELDLEYQNLTRTLKIKKSQYNAQNKRIDIIRDALDFVHHKYLNETIKSVIEQTKKNTRTDEKVNKIIKLRDKDKYSSRTIGNYLSLFIRALGFLNNSPHIDSKGRYNTQQEELDNAVNNVFSTGKQYSGKRAEEIEKRREFYRKDHFDDPFF